MKNSATWQRRIAFALLASCWGLACGRVREDSPGDGGGEAGASAAGRPDDVGGDAGSPSAGGSSAGSAGSAGVGGSDPSLPPLTGEFHDESAGRLVMRRITNREYSNIIADLLGDTGNPGSAAPADAPSETGFEAPSGVEELNVEFYNQSADRLAEAALGAGKLGLPSGCSEPAVAAEEACATQFISAFGGKAYRRPIASDETADLLVLFHAARDSAPAGAGLSFPEAIAQTAKGMLQSPNFLYHWEIGPTKPVLDTTTNLAPLTPYQIASRLAEMLWESMPDESLLNAADAGKLTTAEQVQTQALRMLNDDRAANALFNFHEQWLLQADNQPLELAALSKVATAFTPDVAQAVGGEFTAFLRSVYGSSGDGTLQTLLTAPYTYANQDIAALYGDTSVTGSDFERIALNPGERAGILTQTAFLAANADDAQDNPVKRGLAVYAKLLCGQVPPPPPASPSPPLDSTKTTRQRFEQLTNQPCASACHSSIDPPGFAFENYDVRGAYRATEAGQAVDASGSFQSPAGATITFKNALDLSNRLAESSEVKWCVDRQWLRYTLGRMDSDAERGSLERAYQKAGSTPGYSLRDMVISLVGSVSFRFRAPSPGEAL
jgi:Protein of unknown function (DUF1592)/Protein of unknown function (DUF1588)/Protein of unknown function (DUF1595)/Protein of unknown function (DUF1585)/Protein of unknown function (DUF1587)